MGRQAKFACNYLLNSARSLSGESMGDCRRTNIEFFSDAGQGPSLLPQSCFNVLYMHRIVLAPSI
jgi:hypothetical protein